MNTFKTAFKNEEFINTSMASVLRQTKNFTLLTYVMVKPRTYNITRVSRVVTDGIYGAPPEVVFSLSVGDMSQYLNA